ncbi:hypothetical protein [Chryseobacterium sp.]|uniref:hypothetical protein n=1 Tax=Chryseobacterium sp. TaxID=1871047 RepID=UPI000EE16487|nr:hypothetical protein [Chryseobacterium sp.]HCA06244.1 hypothetical protein [Chryseobacterium sp.]
MFKLAEKLMDSYENLYRYKSKKRPVMDQNVINTYAVKFENKTMSWEGFPGKENCKIIETNNYCLTCFLTSWKSVSQINDSLLPDINAALADPALEIESDTATIDIIMCNHLVDFYDRQGYVNSIPLKDFKEIVTLWRDFLTTRPLNSAKIYFTFFGFSF